MSKQELPHFNAATLPLPQQWEGRFIWRSDTKAMQYSTGTAWVDASVSGAGISSVAILGDSITNATATISASRIDYNVLGYYTYLKSLMQGRVNLIGEYGYSGFKIAQLSQHIPTLLQQRPSCVIYLAGTNDVFWADPIAGVMAADTANMAALLAGGVQSLIVLGVTPRSDIVSDPARQLYTKQLDENKRAFCASNPRATYVDLKQVLADPATGDWASGLANIDGVHPIPAGSLRIARAAAVPLDSLASIESPLVVGYRDPLNLIFNGALAGSNASGTNGYSNTAGMTGSGPDGWRAQISGGSVAGVVSSVARPTIDLRAGNCAQIAVTGDSTGANGAQLQFRTLSAAWASGSYARGAAVRPTVPNGFRYVVVSANGSTAGSEPAWPATLGATVVDNAVTWMCCLDFQPGQYVQASIEVEPSSFSGNFDLTLAVQALNESSTLLFTAGDMLNAADVATQPSFGAAYQPRLRLMTAPMLLPAGVTRLYTTIGARAPAGVTGNLKVSAARLDIVPSGIYVAN